MTAPRSVAALYRGQGWATRARVWLRWASAPLDAVVAELPVRGRVLDWGCGHGVVALEACRRYPDVEVEGVDIDARKVAAASRAARAGGVDDRATFRCRAAHEVPAGTWDAVVVADVLYLLAPGEQEAVVRAAARSVEPGGVLVVKEVGTKPRWKAVVGSLQERVSVGLLRITEATDGIYPAAPPWTIERWLQEEGLEAEIAHLDRGYHVPHAMVVARRTAPRRDADMMPS